MEYLQNLSRDMKTIQNQVARMSKRGNKKKRVFKRTGRGPTPSVTPKNLERDFNREAEGEGTLEAGEVPPVPVGRPLPLLPEARVFSIGWGGD